MPVGVGNIEQRRLDIGVEARSRGPLGPWRVAGVVDHRVDPPVFIQGHGNQLFEIGGLGHRAVEADAAELLG